MRRLFDRWFLLAWTAICVLSVLLARAHAEPVRMPQSVVNMIPDFEARVIGFKAQRAAWEAQQRAIAEWRGSDADPAKPAPYPAPLDFTAVMMSSGADGYVIYDDGPTPAQKLSTKKRDLLAQIAAAEVAELETIVPAAKRRAFQVREADIRAQDVVRRTWLDSVRLWLGADASKLAERRRPTHDTDFMRAQHDNHETMDRVRRQAAAMMSEVEDLTATTVDGWKMKPFN